MANTFQLLASISSTLKNITYQSFQGIDGASIDKALDVLTNGTQPLQYSLDVSSASIITLWDKDDSHGIAKLGLAFIVPTVNGMLEWLVDAEANNDDASCITLRAFVPFIMVGDSVSKEISGFTGYTTIDVLGTPSTPGPSTLVEITRVRFLNLDPDNAGQVNILASE